MTWRRLTRQLALTGAAGASCFLIGRGVHLGAQTIARPFYLETVMAVRNKDDGKLAPRKTINVARKTDGTTVSIESVGLLKEHLSIREIVSPEGTAMRVYDSLKRKTTWPTGPENDGMRLRAQLQSAPADCATVDDQATMTGSGDVAGVATVKLQVRSDKRIVDRELAPSLACQELYATSQELQPDGSWLKVYEKTTTKLIQGEPDPTLFIVNADYVETKPSDALNALIATMSSQHSADAMRAFRREGMDADRRYQPRGTVQP